MYWLWKTRLLKILCFRWSARADCPATVPLRVKICPYHPSLRYFSAVIIHWKTGRFVLSSKTDSPDHPIRDKMKSVPGSVCPLTKYGESICMHLGKWNLFCALLLTLFHAIIFASFISDIWFYTFSSRFQNDELKWRPFTGFPLTGYGSPTARS